jgi:hypothetical protein
MDDASHTAGPQWSRPSFAVIGADAFLAARPATAVQVAQACARAGYDAAIPATWGDELIAARCAQRLADRTLGPAIFCSCALVRDRLMAPGPDLLPFVLSFVAPPVASARYLRALYAGRPIDITYIGACPSADDEAIDRVVAPAAFFAELRTRGISLAEQPTVFESTFAPDRRRHVSQPGGLPAPELLGEQRVPRRIVEIGSYDYAADLAQHLILNEPVLADIGVRAGCLCAGASAGGGAVEARRAVVALEPPRSAQPIVEPGVHAMVDLPLAPPPDADRGRPWIGPPGDRYEDLVRARGFVEGAGEGAVDRVVDDLVAGAAGDATDDGAGDGPGDVADHAGDGVAEDGSGAAPVGGSDSGSWFASTARGEPFDATFDVQFDAAFRLAFVPRPGMSIEPAASGFVGDREMPLAAYLEATSEGVAAVDLADASALDERIYDERVYGERVYDERADDGPVRDGGVADGGAAAVGGEEETPAERRVALRRAADVEAYRVERAAALRVEALVDVQRAEVERGAVERGAVERTDVTLADVTRAAVVCADTAEAVTVPVPAPRAVEHEVAGLINGVAYFAAPPGPEISHGHLTELRVTELRVETAWAPGIGDERPWPRATAAAEPRPRIDRERVVRIPASIEPTATRRPVRRSPRATRPTLAARVRASLFELLTQCGRSFVRVPASVYVMSVAAAVAIAVFVSASVHTRRSFLAHVESTSSSITGDIGR